MTIRNRLRIYIEGTTIRLEYRRITFMEDGSGYVNELSPGSTPGIIELDSKAEAAEWAKCLIDSVASIGRDYEVLYKS